MPTPARHSAPFRQLPAIAAGWAIAACWVAPAILPPVLASAQPSVPASPQPGTGDDLSLLGNLSASLQARQAAARRLLSSADPDARARLDSVLSARPAEPVQTGSEPGADPSQSARLVLLRVITEQVSAPPWLAAPLIQIGRGDAPDAARQSERVAAIAALGSVRTRDAVRGLITIAGAPDTPAPLLSTCYAALARLSGREDLGTDHRAWSMWLTQIEWLPEAEWRRVLAEGLAGQIDGVLRERDAAVTRLVDAFRKDVQAATNVEDRSRLIERAIRDDIVALRRAGFAAALQELANTRALDQRVAQAAQDQLRSDQAQTRRAAAELLNVLAPPGLGEALEHALRAETDPSVAALLVRGVTRWPSQSVQATVLKWLEYGEPTRTPAIDAAEALLDRGWLSDQPSRDRVLAALKLSPLEQLSPGGARLLFVLGGQNERDAVMRAIRSAEPARAQVLAEALAKDPAAAEVLLSAARTDASMFIPAARALAAHAPSALAYAALESLPAPSSDVRRSMLAMVATRLPPSDLLVVARDQDDAEVREAMLARLTSEPLRRMFDPAQPNSPAIVTQHPNVVAGLLLLCDTRLELGQPAAALRALDALAPMGEGVDVSVRDAMRTEALVWLGRLEEAQAAAASADAWLAGLGRCADQPHASQVVSIIERRFGSQLSKEHGERLSMLRDRVATFVGPRQVR